MKPNASRIERMLAKIEAAPVPPSREWLAVIVDDTDDEAENWEWPMFLYCPWAWRVCSTLSQAADAQALGSYLPGMSDGLFGSKEATRISILERQCL